MIDQIPLVDLQAQYASIRDEVLAAVDEVLVGMHLTLGPNVSAFEREFAAYCGAAACVGVGSGTEALWLALQALGIGIGAEVIVPAHTFIATAEAVSLAGARPVIVDVEPESRCIDPSLVERAIGTRTRAIIAVHMHGQMADLDALTELCSRHGIALIEDAAQAHGAELRGRRAGSIGTLGCFSFYCSKNLGAYGEAGAITTSDPELMERLRLLRNHGDAGRYEHVQLGTNSRLDELAGGDPADQAAQARRMERRTAPARGGLSAEARGPRNRASGRGRWPAPRLPSLRGSGRQPRPTAGRIGSVGHRNRHSLSPARCTCNRPTPDSAISPATTPSPNELPSRHFRCRCIAELADSADRTRSRCAETSLPDFR